MADETIVYLPETTDLRVSGRKITAFSNTGTFIEIEKIAADTAFEEGLFGTSAHTRQNSKGYRMSVTIVQGSEDDKYLSRARRALLASKSVLSVTLNHDTRKYGSNSVSIEADPVRSIAADSTPMITYVLVGTFPVLITGTFGAAQILTEEQINNFG